MTCTEILCTKDWLWLKWPFSDYITSAYWTLYYISVICYTELSTLAYRGTAEAPPSELSRAVGHSDSS